jgi:hypothetical protein
MHNMKSLIHAYGDWIIQQQKEFWDVFYINIMFNAFAGSDTAILSQMTRQVETRLYPAFCRAVERHPGRAGRQRWLPRMVLFPDLPCFKHRKISLQEATINRGLHLNGFISISPHARLKTFLSQYIATKQHHFVTDRINRVHAEPVTSHQHKVADYAMKDENAKAGTG